MILADTSVWIDHIRAPDEALAELIASDRIVMHPHVLGEIALGSVRDRETLIFRLERLPPAPLARDREVRILIETGRLAATGIGYTDAHLLASCRLLTGTRLWTRDKRLQAQADRLQVSYGR